MTAMNATTATATTAPPSRRPLIGISGAAGEARTYLGPASWQGVATTYVRAVQAAGGAPVVLGPLLDAESVSALVPRLDGLVLTGGGDIDPAMYGQPATMALGVDVDRDRLERQLLGEALTARLPVLAICRGMQMLNVALGGTLLQHLGDGSGHFDRAGPLRHHVTVTPGSLLERVTGCRELTVNSLHHQAVQDLAPGLRVIGVDENGVVEALEVDGDDRVLGVQWHPELLVDEPAHAALFSWVVGAATRV
jgi:putative glutamine amidotransferase